MKIKIIITSLLTALLTLNFSFAQTVSNSCLDLKFNMKSKSRDINTKGEVTKLQNFLISNGYLVEVNANGNYGPATVRAVKDFQEANNLIVTGIAGKVTREKVGEVSCIIINNSNLEKNLNYRNLEDVSISSNQDGVGQLATIEITGELSSSEKNSLSWKIIETPSGIKTSFPILYQDGVKASFTPTEKGTYRILLKTKTSERAVTITSYDAKIPYNKTKIKPFSRLSYLIDADCEKIGCTVTNQFSVGVSLTAIEFEDLIKKYQLLKIVGQTSKASWYVEQINDSAEAKEQLELLILEKGVRMVGNRFFGGASVY